jgi:hypothetical protein
MKGFEKKKIRHFTFNDFKHYLTGELKTLKITQAPKFATFKTALRKGRFLCMNFDPNTDRQIDRDKLHIANEELLWFTNSNNNDADKMLAIHPQLSFIREEQPELYNDLMSRKNEEIAKKIKSLKSQISSLSRKLKKNEYKESERSIKSEYDKRIITKKGFDSDPIHITEEGVLE